MGGHYSGLMKETLKKFYNVLFKENFIK